MKEGYKVQGARTIGWQVQPAARLILEILSN